MDNRATHAKEQDAASMKRVALLLPSSLTESFEIVLARAADLATDPGTELTLLTCNGSTRGCVASALVTRSLCGHCRSVRDAALGALLPGAPIAAIDDFAGAPAPIDEAMERELHNGVVSTLKTFYRIDMESKRTPLLRRLAFGPVARRWQTYSRFAFRGLRNYVAERRPDRLEFFNGRIVPTRSALLAAERSGIDYGVVEVSGAARTLFTTTNAQVHSLRFIKAELDSYRRSGRADADLARKFFEGRRGGQRTDDQSYVANQRAGLLPELGDRKVVAAFTSSPDELEIVGEEWFTPAALDPAGFLAGLRATLPDDYHLVVRIHPNQRGDRTGRTDDMLARIAKLEGTTLIRPEDPASSYELLDRADCALSFGSTIGLEATYWQRPSILAGRAIWEDLDVTYLAERPEEVVALIARNAPPRSKEDALLVGSFLMDERGDSTSLTWGDGGRDLFFVKGRNYLGLKRGSIHYWLARLVDRVLRMNW
jgi:hypothetical protein